MTRASDCTQESHLISISLGIPLQLIAFTSHIVVIYLNKTTIENRLGIIATLLPTLKLCPVHTTITIIMVPSLSVTYFIIIVFCHSNGSFILNSRLFLDTLYNLLDFSIKTSAWRDHKEGYS